MYAVKVYFLTFFQLLALFNVLTQMFELVDGTDILQTFSFKELDDPAVFASIGLPATPVFQPLFDEK